MKNTNHTKAISLLGLLIVSSLSGCGNVAPTVSKIPTLPKTTPPINVQLNAQQTYDMGTESVRLSDSRRFTVPAAIEVVAGTFNCGSPGCNNTVMRAEMLVGGSVCRYESNDVQDEELLLLDCNGAPLEVAMVSGDTITLNPSYAPGLLLEVSFTLVQ